MDFLPSEQGRENRRTLETGTVEDGAVLFTAAACLPADFVAAAAGRKGSAGASPAADDATTGGTLISFTSNIAGGVKKLSAVFLRLCAGQESILLQLQFAGAEVLQQEEVHQPTGDELCLLTDLEPLR